MKKKIEILNEIFDAELVLDDLEKEVDSVLEWNSFQIMNFLVEIEERYHRKVTIEQISEIKYIRELLTLMESEGNKACF